MSEDQENKLPDLDKEVERERNETLQQLESWLEVPVMILGAVWLLLLVIDLAWGLSPFLNVLVYIIWGIFILDFLVRFFLAPRKVAYLTRNWLTVLSLLIPALRIGRVAQMLRIARVARVARATRGLRLVRVISSINRGMRALRRTMQRRGFGYVLGLTIIVIIAGAAGMYTFEQPKETGGAGLTSYGEALWWTAMILTTMGSEYWPQTAEGRMLALLLSLYAFTVFGYVTATLATFFIGRDAAEGQLGGEEESEPGGDLGQSLRGEIASLREEISALRQALNQERDQNDDNALHSSS